VRPLQNQNVVSVLGTVLRTVAAATAARYILTTMPKAIHATSSAVFASVRPRYRVVTALEAALFENERPGVWYKLYYCLSLPLPSRYICHDLQDFDLEKLDREKNMASLWTTMKCVINSIIV
jgi:hypothetical protein